MKNFHLNVTFFFFFLNNVGTDITIVAHSLGVQKAMESAEILEKEGISCEVIFEIVSNNSKLASHVFHVQNLCDH